MGAQIIERPPCEMCGHRARIVVEGLPDDVAKMLADAVARSGLSRSEVCRRAGLSTSGSYFANLLDGLAKPSKPVARDLIRVLGLSWVDGERLLAASGSERDRRRRRPE